MLTVRFQIATPFHTFKSSTRSLDQQPVAIGTETRQYEVVRVFLYDYLVALPPDLMVFNKTICRKSEEQLSSNAFYFR